MSDRHPSLQGLRNDYIDAKPVSVEWTFSEYDEGGCAELVYPDCSKLAETPQELSDILSDFSSDVPPRDEFDSEDLWQEALEEHVGDFGPEEIGIVPMMNYAYPIGEDRVNASEAQALLFQRCVCAVNLNGSLHLALTGGGMDLSWPICAAYVTLGYLPPVHFAARLPRMAGGSGCDVLTARAAVLSCEIAQTWAENAHTDAQRVLEWLQAEKVEVPS